MDDSPMYDEVHLQSKTYTMNLYDVGLNSLYALDAECLAKIAAILGEADIREICRGIRAHEAAIGKSCGTTRTESTRILLGRPLLEAPFSYQLLPHVCWHRHPGTSEENGLRAPAEYEGVLGNLRSPDDCPQRPRFSRPVLLAWRHMGAYQLYGLRGIERYGSKGGARIRAEELQSFHGRLEANQHDKRAVPRLGRKRRRRYALYLGCAAPLIATEQYIDETLGKVFALAL